MDLIKTENKRAEILTRIISKGGLLGSCAKIYINDKVKAHQFILECSEQCHHSLIINHFGEELVADIIKYCKNSNKKMVY